jgi:hypothetical protein
MVDTMPYQYRTTHRYPRIEAKEGYAEGHKLRMTERRRKGESKWAHFKPRCSCGWKSNEWFLRKDHAYNEHERHIKEFELMNPKLF